MRVGIPGQARQHQLIAMMAISPRLENAVVKDRLAAAKRQVAIQRVHESPHAGGGTVSIADGRLGIDGNTRSASPVRPCGSYRTAVRSSRA